jgi:hypothetical protein
MKVFDKYKGVNGSWVVYFENVYFSASNEYEADKLMEDLDDVFGRGYDEGYRDGYNTKGEF